MIFRVGDYFAFGIDINRGGPPKVAVMPPWNRTMKGAVSMTRTPCPLAGVGQQQTARITAGEPYLKSINGLLRRLGIDAAALAASLNYPGWCRPALNECRRRTPQSFLKIGISCVF